MHRIAIVVVCLILISGCKPGGAPVAFKMPPPAVNVTPAITRDAPLYLDEIGAMTARQYVSVTPRVTGPVTKIHFTDGAELHPGDVLFTIDPRPYQATLDQALADQQRNKAAAELAAKEHQRMEDLIHTQAISQDDYDKMKNADDMAVAALAGSDAAVETARLNVEYCTITSPIEGRAGQRLVDVGNVVMANQGSMLVIQTLDPIYADFTCVESDLAAVREYAKAGTLKVMVKLPGDVGEGHEGELTFIDTQVVDQAGRVKLRATLNNPDRHFWPGQFVSVRVILETIKDAVLVPASAVQIAQSGSEVFVVKADQTAELRPVKIGQRQGDLVVVEDGLHAGENIITSGLMTVIPGGAVNVINGATTKPAAEATTEPATQPATGS